jgi:superfamily II helicase
MDINTISSVLGSFGLTVNFVKNSIDKIKDVAVREKVQELLNTIIPLQSIILSLQSTNSTLIQEKDALEQKLREIENWNQEASSYQLKELAPGVYVYVKKKGVQTTEPIYYICAKCYKERKIYILQRTKHDYAGIHYICHSCSSEIIDYSKAIPLSKPKDGPKY